MNLSKTWCLLGLQTVGRIVLYFVISKTRCLRNEYHHYLVLQERIMMILPKSKLTDFHLIVRRGASSIVRDQATNV